MRMHGGWHFGGNVNAMLVSFKLCCLRQHHPRLTVCGPSMGAAMKERKFPLPMATALLALGLLLFTGAFLYSGAVFDGDSARRLLQSFFNSASQVTRCWAQSQHNACQPTVASLQLKP